MRILNWNVDHAKRGVLSRQLARIDEIASDIEVLTEPGQPNRFESDGKVVVHSPTQRYRDESWVLIRGVGLERIVLAVPYERMATAAKARIENRDIVIYASVLPWNAATSHSPDVFGFPPVGIPTAAIYGSWLTSQLRDLWILRDRFPSAALFWVGDFNTPVLKPFKYHNRAGSEMLIQALSNFGFRAYNGNMAHRNSELHAVDLICGPSTIMAATTHVDRRDEILALSDHALYWADVSLD